MSLELTGVHGLLKRHKLFTHKYIKMEVYLWMLLYNQDGYVLLRSYGVIILFMFGYIIINTYIFL